MEFILYTLFITFFIALITLKKYQLNNFTKNFLIYGYFFIYPVFSLYLPEIRLYFLIISPNRLFQIILALLMFPILFINLGKIKLSPIVISFTIYSLYLLFNSWILGQLQKNEIVNRLLPIFFFILIDNLEYGDKDRRIFENVILILVFIAFIVSFIQLTISHNFMRSIAQYDIHRIYGDIYRNPSIYQNMRLGGSSITMGISFVFVLFLNFYRYKLKLLLLAFFAGFSAFVTFTRFVWLIMLTGIFYFIYYKYKGNRKIIVLITIVIALIIFYNTFFSTFQQTELYSKRIVSETYTGRLISLDIYLKHFLGKNLIFGFGQSSKSSGLLNRYGRSSIHIGIIEIFFFGGLFGIILFLIFWYYIYKKAKLILKKTGNPLFIAFITIFILINLTAVFHNIVYFGYFLMIFYLKLYEKTTFNKQKMCKNLLHNSNNIQ